MLDVHLLLFAMFMPSTLFLIFLNGIWSGAFQSQDLVCAKWLCIGRMALCKAAIATTNVVVETECAFSRLDAFLGKHRCQHKSSPSGVHSANVYHFEHTRYG